MNTTRSRNLIWLARSADPLAGGNNLARAWEVAVDQMGAARRTGDRAGAARWEAEADRLYVRITGSQPVD
jgi:hypothetical protein